MTLPNFLVIGAQRAGTTLLHRILETHPEIYVPYRRKEVHYFDRYFDRGAQWYQKFFPPSGCANKYRAIGEVTPDYIFEQEIPIRIHGLLPNCKFIVSLRNPVDRAYSAYSYAVRNGNDRRSIDDFFMQSEDTLQRGCYSVQLGRYFDLFPREAFLVLVYEKLIINPAGELARMAAFLDLDHGWDDPSALLGTRVNTSESPRFRAAFACARRFGVLLTRNDLDWVVRLGKRSGIPKLFGTRAARPVLPEPTRRWLQEFYRGEITRLESLLGIDLNAWRAGSGETARSDARALQSNTPAADHNHPPLCGGQRARGSID